MNTTGSKVLDGFWKLSALIERFHITDDEITAASSYGFNEPPNLQIKPAAWEKCGFIAGPKTIPDEERGTIHCHAMVDGVDVVAIFPAPVPDIQPGPCADQREGSV